MSPAELAAVGAVPAHVSTACQLGLELAAARSRTLSLVQNSPTALIKVRSNELAPHTSPGPTVRHRTMGNRARLELPAARATNSTAALAGDEPVRRRLRPRSIHRHLPRRALTRRSTSSTNWCAPPSPPSTSPAQRTRYRPHSNPSTNTPQETPRQRAATRRTGTAATSSHYLGQSDEQVPDRDVKRAQPRNATSKGPRASRAGQLPRGAGLGGHGAVLDSSVAGFVAWPPACSTSCGPAKATTKKGCLDSSRLLGSGTGSTEAHDRSRPRGRLHRFRPRGR